MAKDDKAPVTKEYVLKPGKRHIGADGHVYVGGQKDNDRVQLNERQAKAFADKFESVEEMNERLKLQDEVKGHQAKLDKIARTLEAKGMSLDDLLAEAETTNKEPTPSTTAPKAK